MLFVWLVFFSKLWSFATVQRHLICSFSCKEHFLLAITPKEAPLVVYLFIQDIPKTASIKICTRIHFNAVMNLHLNRSRNPASIAFIFGFSPKLVGECSNLAMARFEPQTFWEESDLLIWWSFKWLKKLQLPQNLSHKIVKSSVPNF